MPRNISFMLTQSQIEDEIKTETRRLGWLWLSAKVKEPGMGLVMLQGVKKGMGLKKGKKVEKLKMIYVHSAHREPLNTITQEGVIAEGFPDWTPAQFVDFFCAANKCKPTDLVTVIKFGY